MPSGKKVRVNSAPKIDVKRGLSGGVSGILVTGGAGFIGYNFIHYLFGRSDFSRIAVNVDKLTYAGNLENLEEIEKKFAGKLYFFEKGDICDSQKVSDVFVKYGIDMVLNFAAESHVDRSIHVLRGVHTNQRGPHLQLAGDRPVVLGTKTGCPFPPCFY